MTALLQLLLAAGAPSDPSYASVSLLLPLTTNFNATKGPNFTASGAAISSGSALFDGTNDYASAGANAAFGFGSGDYTVEGFVQRATASTGNRCIFDNRSGGGDEGIAIYTSNLTGSLGFAVYDNSGKIVDTAVLVSDSSFDHWAVARDAGDLFVYINGVQIGTVNDARTLAATPGCVIGDNYLTASHPFAGRQKWLRLTKGVCRYPNGTTFTPPTLPLPSA